MGKIGKQNKILVTSLLSVFMLTSFTSTTTLAEGEIDKIQAPSILTSAYQAAQQNIASKDADKANAESKKSEEKSEDKKEDKKEDGENKDDKAKENSASKEKESKESKENLNKNLTKIMSSGNFGTVGILFGPTSPISHNNFAALQNTMSLDKAGIQSLDANSGGNGKAVGYHQFGLAIQKLQDYSANKDVSMITVDNDARSMTKVATTFSNVGFKILREYNPSPILLSFYDSSYLTNANYAGSNGNKLIKLVNQNEPLRGFIKFFGDPGQFGVSRAGTLIILLGFLSILFGLFQKMWNGKNYSYIFRRFLVRLVVGFVLFPLGCFIFTEGIEAISNYKNNADYNRDNSIIRKNLNMLDWYQNASFGIPVGTQLVVKNGEFQFTEDDIYNINKFSAKNALTGEGNDDDKYLALRIIAIATNANNRVKVTFHPSYSVSNEGGKAQRLPWDTGKIIKVADSFANNTKIADDIDIGSIDYFKGALQMSINGDTVTYSMRKHGYGISPLASYNLLNTTFNENGFNVRSNTEQGQMVGVGINAVKFSSNNSTGSVSKNELKEESGNSDTAPSLVLFFVALRLVFTGIKGLSDVFITTFGSIFRGGTSAAVGKSYGIAMLVGGIFAVFAGLLGVSIMVDFCINLIDPVYVIVKEVGVGVIGSDGLMKAMENAPFPINWIAKMITDGIIGLIISIMAIFFIPQLLMAPLSAFINWIKGIPPALADRAQRWENQFINSYGAPTGRQLGSGSSSSSTSSGGMFSNAGQEAKATMAGAGMMLGALSGYLGGKIAGEGKHGGKSVSEAVNENEEKDGEETNVEQTDATEVHESVDPVETTDPEQLDPVEEVEPVHEEKQENLGEGEEKEPIQPTEAEPLSKGIDPQNPKEKDNKQELNKEQNPKQGDKSNDPASIVKNFEDKDEVNNLEKNEDNKNNENEVVNVEDNDQVKQDFNDENKQFNGDLNKAEVISNKFDEQNKMHVNEDVKNNDNVKINGQETNDIKSVETDNSKVNLDSESGLVSNSVTESIRAQNNEGVVNNTSTTETGETQTTDVKDDSSGVKGGVIGAATAFTASKLSAVKDKATKTVKNENGKEMSAIRLATGRGLMAINDKANRNNKNHGKKYQGRVQLATGALHMMGGLTGTHKHTQKLHDKVKGVNNKKGQGQQATQQVVYDDYPSQNVQNAKKKAKKKTKTRVTRSKVKSVSGNTSSSKSNASINRSKTKAISNFSKPKK